MQHLIPFSFELFPPNTETGHEKLHAAVTTLRAFHPVFFSVTFGAGGAATQALTTHVVKALIDRDIKTAPHITCTNLSEKAVDQLLQYYQSLHVTNLVVIRGDAPALSEERSESIFLHASDLVRYIRKKTGNDFKIYVAAYPEFHPESENAETELHFFKEKIEAGANAAITQYFFSREAYDRYRENCIRKKIYVPIIPGIMPIMQYDKLMRFSKRCQAEIPRWLDKRLQAYQHQPESLQALGIDVMTKLCDDLISDGAPQLHFYTLNSAEITTAIIRNLFNMAARHHQQYVLRNAR